MSEYLHVEKPFLDQLAALGCTVVDQGHGVKSFIVPHIVLFVNGIPLVVIEAKIGDATTANPMHAAFEQLLRYRNGRSETHEAGLREGEPRLFHTNLLLISTCARRRPTAASPPATSISTPGRISGRKAIAPTRRRSAWSASRSG